MAFSKEEKAQILSQYEKWVKDSQATFLMEYSKMDMKAIDTARAKIRDAGGELHVVKNTLFSLALKNSGMDQPKGYLEDSTIIGFAFKDAAALAKVFNEITNRSETFKVKGGYLGKNTVSTAEIKALADLPPLPVMRARILGMLLAPASQLVRTINEPARGLAAVVKAYSEKETAAA